MNVDVHSHIVDRQYLDNLVSTLALATESTNDGKRLFRKDGSTVAWSRDDMFDIDRRFDDMDKKDMAVRILSLSAPNVYLWNGIDHVAAARHINDALAKLCRHYPDRRKPAVERYRSFARRTREPIWAKINLLRLPVFEHPMFPRNSAGLEGFELPLRLGLIFDTTLAATRLIYSGIFERYPIFLTSWRTRVARC